MCHRVKRAGHGLQSRRARSIEVRGGTWRGVDDLTRCGAQRTADGRAEAVGRCWFECGKAVKSLSKVKPSPAQTNTNADGLDCRTRMLCALRSALLRSSRSTLSTRAVHSTPAPTAVVSVRIVHHLVLVLVLSLSLALLVQLVLDVLLPSLQLSPRLDRLQLSLLGLCAAGLLCSRPPASLHASHCVGRTTRTQSIFRTV